MRSAGTFFTLGTPPPPPRPDEADTTAAICSSVIARTASQAEAQVRRTRHSTSARRSKEPPAQRLTTGRLPGEAERQPRATSAASAPSRQYLPHVPDRR